MSTPKPTAKQILEEVTQAIKDITTTKQADRETIRIFTQVEKNTADDLIERLEHLPAILTYYSASKTPKLVLMPTRTHQVPFIWINQSIGRAYRRQILTDQDFNELWVSGNEAHEAFSAPYVGSFKNPDVLFQPASSSYPSVFVEVGWTETLADLHCDGDLLLRGFQDGTTRLAILIKWTPDRATMVVRGVLEVWELVNGTPTLRETKKIFPAPNSNNSQPLNPSSDPRILYLTRAEIFSGSTLQIQNPSGLVSFSLDELRTIATRRLTDDGYTPA